MNWIFIVDDNTWPEHLKAGIAGINRPPSNKDQQAAMSELIGVRPGDYLFFNLRASETHPPQILGLYEATTEPFYDPEPLFPEAQVIGARLPYDLPYRVGFKQVVNYEKPLDMAEIWLLRERGLIWSIQQSRGDAIGVHACIAITRPEAEVILRMLEATNPVKPKPVQVPPPPSTRKPLPLDLRTGLKGNLHYEAVLRALLVQGLASGQFKDVLGDYDEFIPNFLTGARLEIDVLLLKYSGNDIAWYGILEAKSDVFTYSHFKRLLDYESWFIRTKAISPIQVHPIVVAHDISQILEHARAKLDHNKRGVKLIQYRFQGNTLSLSEVAVKP
ncbi:EVE domain-containing protein [Dehalococcoidales bacterium]|nr:EVE domain-containing protein [Dehalococcoidales bacterium]